VPTPINNSFQLTQPNALHFSSNDKGNSNNGAGSPDTATAVKAAAKEDSETKKNRSKKEIRAKLLELIVDPEVKSLFYKSMVLIFASKALAIASPWFLKSIVDSMSVAGT